MNELQVKVKPLSMDEFYVLVDCDIGKELIRYCTVITKSRAAFRIRQRGNHDELTNLTDPQELHLFQDTVARLSNPVEVSFQLLTYLFLFSR